MMSPKLFELFNVPELASGDPIAPLGGVAVAPVAAAPGTGKYCCACC